ncbi:MAG: helix-turn-helix transcriptional regulator [Lachnospiraceae bacterium]|jgi:transcriptional regulator with XRE-family HTH domain|nr:helix-turn-helix transcriptional regulator [Lachnospiraceae bacterium]
MNQNREILGDVVRTTRKSRHLSQEALAERIGVCKRTIIDIENNIGNPKFEILYPLVRELDLPLYQVLYPEVEENSELKNVLMQEVSSCSEHELRIILSLVKSLRCIFRNEDQIV